MQSNISKNDGRGIWSWNIVKVVTILSLLVYLAVFYFNGFSEESTRVLIRITAKTSLVLFCTSFGASAFHRWQKNSFSWWIFMNRKFFGISFAIIHLIHLGFIFLLEKKFHPVFDELDLVSLLAGSLAYTFLILMLLTSFPFFAKKLSAKNWRILHTIGGYWILFIFSNSIFSKLFAGRLEYLPLALLILFVLFLRIWKFKSWKN